MRDLDKEFEDTRKQIVRAFQVTLIFNIVLSIVAFACIGWLAYVILKQF